MFFHLLRGIGDVVLFFFCIGVLLILCLLPTVGLWYVSVFLIAFPFIWFYAEAKIKRYRIKKEREKATKEDPYKSVKTIIIK